MRPLDLRDLRRRQPPAQVVDLLEVTMTPAVVIQVRVLPTSVWNEAFVMILALYRR